MDGDSITYATSKDWLDIMKNRSRVRMHELIERLGLRAKWSSNKRGKTNFETSLVREMVADMADVVGTLPKESDELMKFLSDEGSLKNEVDGLIERHGAKVWGRAGDRDHLITANEPGVEEGLYPRDLYIDNEEDKALIHKLLHWWIGLKACNVILARDRLDRERRKKQENRQAREAEFLGHHEGTPASFVALAPNSLLHHDTDTGSRGSPMSSSAMLTPPESGESPIAGPREGTGFMAINGGPNGYAAANSHQAHPEHHPHRVVEGIWNKLDARAASEHGASYAPAQAAESEAAAQEHALLNRQISVDLARLAINFNSPAVQPAEVPVGHSGIPYRGLDYETLRMLRSFIYGEEFSGLLNSDILFSRIEEAWRIGVRADLDQIIEDVPVFMARERALFTWIELQRHLNAVEEAEKRWLKEGTSLPEIERRVVQHRSLMAATQIIIATYDEIGLGLGSRPDTAIDRDELLRQAIVRLAGSKYAVELQWKNVVFSQTIQKLRTHFEDFRRDEEAEEQGMLWYAR